MDYDYEHSPGRVGRPPAKRGPLTKAQMDADLRNAVLNTGGKLVVGNPKADHVAWAIVTAARALDVHPLTVIKGAGPWRDNDSKGERRAEIKHARIYAALALYECFPDTPKMMLGRLVGVEGSQKSYIWNCEHARTIGAYGDWWDDKIFRAVVLQIQKV